MSHTPGPWLSGRKSRASNFAKHDEPVFRIHGDHMVLADVRSSEDDARLIAAAPDLLAACKLMLRAIRDGGVSTIECVNTAAEAIARAEGK